MLADWRRGATGAIVSVRVVADGRVKRSHLTEACQIRNANIMARITLKGKLVLLSDAAKYDASCASSGTTRRHSADGKGLGSTERAPMKSDGP